MIAKMYLFWFFFDTVVQQYTSMQRRDWILEADNHVEQEQFFPFGVVCLQMSQVLQNRRIKAWTPGKSNSKFDAVNYFLHN